MGRWREGCGCVGRGGVVVVKGCMTNVFVDKTPTHASNYGSRVPVDTTPGPVPVYKTLKSRPISSSPG